MAARRTDLVKAASADPVKAADPAPDPATVPLPVPAGPRHAAGGDRPPAGPEDVLAEPPDGRDIAAELTAAPRRRLPWPTLLLSAGVVAALAFTGGVLVEKGHTSSGARGGAAAFAGRGGGFGGTRGGTGTGAGAGTGTGAGAAGGGRGGAGAPGAASGVTFGTVKLVDGSTIYVSDAQGDIVKVTTAKATTVSESRTGKVSDLKPGQTVTVRGSANSSGDIKATTVTEGGAGGFGGFGGAGGFGGGRGGAGGAGGGTGGGTAGGGTGGTGSGG